MIEQPDSYKVLLMTAFCSRPDVTASSTATTDVDTLGPLCGSGAADDILSC
jgi:hypothetical protein